MWTIYYSTECIFHTVFRVILQYADTGPYAGGIYPMYKYIQYIQSHWNPLVQKLGYEGRLKRTGTCTRARWYASKFICLFNYGSQHIMLCCKSIKLSHSGKNKSCTDTVWIVIELTGTSRFPRLPSWQLKGKTTLLLHFATVCTEQRGGMMAWYFCLEQSV